jgi:hypothetical protein
VFHLEPHANFLAPVGLVWMPERPRHCHACGTALRRSTRRVELDLPSGTFSGALPLWACRRCGPLFGALADLERLLGEAMLPRPDWGELHLFGITGFEVDREWLEASVRTFGEPIGVPWGAYTLRLEEALERTEAAEVRARFSTGSDSELDTLE